MYLYRAVVFITHAALRALFLFTTQVDVQPRMAPAYANPGRRKPSGCHIETRDAVEVKFVETDVTCRAGSSDMLTLPLPRSLFGSAIETRKPPWGI